jgi:hypothetical protein
VISSLNDPERLMMRHADLSFKTLRERSLFFERLYILEARARQASSAH